MVCECSLLSVSLYTGIVLVLLHFFFKYWYSHWSRNNISCLESSFPFGDSKELILRHESPGDHFKNIYDLFSKMKVPYGGFYFGLRRMLMVVDAEVIKNILVRDFAYFSDRDVYVNEKDDPLTGHLFSLKGQKWKNLRAKLTPTFTSGKMKGMFQTLVDCSKELEIILEKNSGQTNPEPLDIKDILARFTTDVIGSCAFGIECNCLRNPEAKFKEYGLQVFQPRGIELFKNIFFIMAPELMKTLKIKSLPSKIEKFFLDLVKDTVSFREENNVNRRDFMQLLIQLKNKGKVSDDDKYDANIKGNEGIKREVGLTIEEVAAQAFVFFLAGFETSSTTMSFCLLELAINPDIQDKLRKEITEMLEKHNGEYTYDGIMGLSYMDMVVNETLRKYPPLPFLARGCKKDYKLPHSDYILKKGSLVRISILGIHRNPEYYPEPNKFDPERFNEEGKLNRKPCTFMPFGEGPRICIGLRFGLMQTKLGLTVLLKNFNFTLNKKTTLPLIMEPTNLIMSAKDGIWLDSHKIT